jgi:hypothetical protein
MYIGTKINPRKTKKWKHLFKTVQIKFNSNLLINGTTEKTEWATVKKGDRHVDLFKAIWS